MNIESQAESRPGAVLLNGGSRFKLAVFGANVSSGCSVTSAEGTIETTWPESRRIAQAADDAGLDAMIPVARWRGFGGDVNFNDRCFETFTWAAGLAAVTKRIQLFATVQVPSIPAVRAAKEAATIDHISNGRFGLNLVAGWNEAEIRMFGLEQHPHDERYAVSAEWATLVNRIWNEDTFDFAGTYFRCPSVHSAPAPLQKPGPPIMSAGQSPAGTAFAARHADVQFIFVQDVTKAGEVVAGIKRNAMEQHGRRINVMSLAQIVCRDTEAEARDYYHYYVYEKGDWAGAKNLLGAAMPNAQSADYTDEKFVEAVVAGYGAIPMVGTADQIAERMAGLAAAGLDGVTMSWVDYEHGIRQYHDELLPRLQALGLRE